MSLVSALSPFSRALQRYRSSFAARGNPRWEWANEIVMQVTNTGITRDARITSVDPYSFPVTVGFDHPEAGEVRIHVFNQNRIALQMSGTEEYFNDGTAAVRFLEARLFHRDQVMANAVPRCIIDEPFLRDDRFWRLPDLVRLSILMTEPLNPKVAEAVFAFNDAGIVTQLSGDLYRDDLVYLDLQEDVAAAVESGIDNGAVCLPQGWMMAPTRIGPMREALGLDVVPSGTVPTNVVRLSDGEPNRRLARLGGGISRDEAAALAAAVAAACRHAADSRLARSL